MSGRTAFGGCADGIGPGAVRDTGIVFVVSNELRARAIADLEDLAHAIDGPVMVWSNEVFVLTAAANDAVRFYRSRGDVILGLEGFNTDGRHLIPRMDCISDFSSIDRTRPDAADQSADAAISVLRKWASPPQFVTFVIQRAGEDAAVTG